MFSTQSFNENEILTVKNIKVEYPTRKGNLVPVDDVSFSIIEGEILAIVGESGAGKSMTGMAIINLLEPPGRISKGIVTLDGKRIDNLKESSLQKIRGGQIGVIFQDPLTSLNPLFTIGRQLIQTIMTHTKMTQHEAKKYAIELLMNVGITNAEKQINSYPHEFSGGMRQRVVIALALCGNPKLIIADEPTTALDVSIQAQILNLLKEICAKYKTSVLLITHDMGVVRKMAERVAVMYAGKIVEIGNVEKIINHPKHPYTQGLMKCIPAINTKTEELNYIKGTMPRLRDIPAGCSFHPRCNHVMDRCRIEIPGLKNIDGDHKVACWLYDKG